MKNEITEKLEKAVGKITPEALKGTGTKSEFVQFRVTKAEKESLQETAKGLGLQVSDYLLRLHALVAEKLKRQGSLK